MCYHNYTQHSGCGHYGEVYTNRYTVCPTVYAQLSSKRGPSSPPLNPPPEFMPPPPPPKRSSTVLVKDKSRRFFSVGAVLSRSSTSASVPSRRAVSGPEQPVSRTSTSSSIDYNNELGVPDHELAAAAEACPDLRTQTKVCTDPGQVCRECLRWIEPLRMMLRNYDQRKGIRGTEAFREFLMNRPACEDVAQRLGYPVRMEPRAPLRIEGDALQHMRPI